MLTENRPLPEQQSPPEHPLFEGVSLDELQKREQQGRLKSFQVWLKNNPTRMVILSFVLVILSGAVLLTLPISSRSAQATPFITALFTSTSATCVTGLILVDTMLYWSFFGQFVILLLIQIGGLSLLTILSAFGLTLHRHFTLTTTRALADTTASDGLTDTFSLVKKVILITIAAEAAGAAILAWRFSLRMPFASALWKGIFHGVSAFCNAGFDLMGDYSGPFSSLTAFNDDPLVLPVTGLLIISGGLGFIVWNDLLHFPQKKHQLSFHSKLVLIMSAALLLSGALFFYFHEGGTVLKNGIGLGNLPVWQRINASCFQSATLRTAGFNSIDQAALSDPSKLMSSLYMLIGAAPASTGGGIKVTTAALLLAGVCSDLKGKGEETVLLGHRLRQDLIRRSTGLFVMGLAITMGVAFLMSVSQANAESPINYIDLIYESTSAFGTVGLSSAGTPALGLNSHLLLIATMYVGRVGPASLALSFMTKKPLPARQVYPEGRTFVG